MRLQLFFVCLIATAYGSSWPTVAETSVFGPFVIYETIRARLALMPQNFATYVSEHVLNGGSPTALLMAAV